MIEKIKKILKTVLGGIIVLFVGSAIIKATIDLNSDWYEIRTMMKDDIVNVLNDRSPESLEKFNKHMIEVIGYYDDGKDIVIEDWEDGYLNSHIQNYTLSEIKEHLTRLVKNRTEENLAIAKENGFSTYEEYQKAEKKREEEERQQRQLKIAESWGFKSVDAYKIFESTSTFQNKFKDELDRLSNQFETAYKNASQLNKENVGNQQINSIHSQLSNYVNEYLPYGVYQWEGEIYMTYRSGTYDGYNGAGWSDFQVEIRYENDVKFIVKNAKDFLNYIKEKNIKDGDNVYFYGKLNPNSFMPDSFPMAGLHNIDIKLYKLECTKTDCQ